MIKAEPGKWARFIFNRYEEYLLKSHFSGFYLTGSLPEIKEMNSLLITPNHFSWWDGFLIDYAARKLFNKSFYIIMLEEQLRKYRFFRKIGAFSIQPDSIKSIKESLAYASAILNKSDNLLVYYPQGSIEPYDIERLSIKRGLFNLIDGKSNIDVLPAAFRIEYSNLKKPAVYMRFGEILAPHEIKNNKDIYKQCFIENIKQLNCSVHEHLVTSNLFLKGT